ncbi:MAG: flavodoxin family protein [Aeromicrobium sp.]
MIDMERTRTAMVVYRSRTGKTRRFGEDIAAYLRTRGVVATVDSVGDCDMNQLADVDYLLLGCWTNGLFVVLQHPDEPWLAFVRDLPSNVRARVGLFTTYQLLTGSMFAKMRQALAGKVPAPTLELKSRNSSLSEDDKGALDRFVAGE